MTAFATTGKYLKNSLMIFGLRFQTDSGRSGSTQSTTISILLDTVG